MEIDPGRIIVTQGTSPAMLTLFSTILHPGDRVILSDPCYACYPNFIEFAGGEVLSVPVYEADSFQYRVAAVQRMLEESGPETVRAIVVNSPSNPTGTVLDADRMKRLAGLGPWIVSDEIYHGLVYEDREHSILEFTDEAFVFNGFSKLYAMTGWRLGYIIAPERFVRPMQRLCQNFFISANAMAQWAGVAALTEAQADVERMVATYAERRVYMLGRLRAMGFRIDSHPVGAFYILVNASRLMRDSYRLAFHILENARVGVTPGIDFGCGAEGYIRFSYANSLENITRGMDRLEAYLHEHHPGALTG